MGARPRRSAPPRAAAHVFVTDLEAPSLEPDDEHHLASVLRLRNGEHVVAADGAGSWRLCAFDAPGGTRAARGDVALQTIGEVERQERPLPTLTVAFALVKGDRPEWAVQKLTELGVDRIVPMLTGRSVVRPEGPAARARAERLRRVAREAAMQSRRLFRPVVADLTTFGVLAAQPAGVAVADPAGDGPSLEWPTVVIGPEGGWGEDEVPDELPRVCLGPHVLRTETAAVVAGALLASLRAGIVKER